MKASSRKIPSRDDRIASTSSRANPSSGNSLEANPIIDSVAVLASTLRSVLHGDIAADVLTKRKAVSQATRESARGEMANLIHLREILRTVGEGDMGAQLSA